MEVELRFRHLGNEAGRSRGRGHGAMLRCRRPNDRHQESDRVTVRSRVASLAPGAGYGLVVGVVFVLLAFGLAGLITSVDHLPGPSPRPELRWAGDQAIRPGLDAATKDLEAMTGDIDHLGLLGRGALAALAGSKWSVLDSAIANGAVLVGGIRDRTDALRARLIALPGVGRTAVIRLSQESIDRQQRLFDALTATDGLATAWARLAAGGINAAQLSTLLTQHDLLITHAIDAGLERKTKDALASIDRATANPHQAGAPPGKPAGNGDLTAAHGWARGE